MNVQKRWVAYCSGNTLDATEDDWNNFVLKTYLNWRKQALDLDTNAATEAGKTLTEYAEAHYSFAKFTETAQIYQELVHLEAKRHHA
jgi:hypothetical protein